MDFIEQLSLKTEIAQNYLDEVIPRDRPYKTPVYEAMEYSLLAGGKRLRPLLLLAACESFGGDANEAKPFMCAIEMIHTYSLIHDDLPAMDNDDFRRGRLTNHKVYGEAMAILAGDGLLHYAFEIMADACCETSAYSYRRARAMQAIARGAGISGMLGGQSLDIYSEGKHIDKITLENIHLGKTAAMIQGALCAGAILGGGDNSAVSDFYKAGRAIGLAFQIQDDILDITSTQEELGKPIHSDEKNAKATYVSMYGQKEAAAMAKRLLDEATAVFDKHGAKCQFLSDLTRYLLDRKK